MGLLKNEKESHKNHVEPNTQTIEILDFGYTFIFMEQHNIHLCLCAGILQKNIFN